MTDSTTDNARFVVLHRERLWKTLLIAAVFAVFPAITFWNLADRWDSLWADMQNPNVGVIVSTFIGFVFVMVSVPLALIALLAFLCTEWSTIAIDRLRQTLISRRVSLVGLRNVSIPLDDITAVERDAIGHREGRRLVVATESDRIAITNGYGLMIRPQQLHEIHRGILEELKRQTGRDLLGTLLEPPPPPRRRLPRRHG